MGGYVSDYLLSLVITMRKGDACSSVFITLTWKWYQFSHLTLVKKTICQFVEVFL